MGRELAIGITAAATVLFALTAVALLHHRGGDPTSDEGTIPNVGEAPLTDGLYPNHVDEAELIARARARHPRGGDAA